MNCKIVRSRLSAYQDGELPMTRSQAVAQHLEHCAACRLELDNLNRLLSRLGCGDTPAADPGFSTRVMAHLRARPQARLRFLPSLAYTLAVLLIFVSGFLLEMSANGQQAAPAPTAMTFSAVLAESRNMGLLAVQDSTLELLSGDANEK